MMQCTLLLMSLLEQVLDQMGPEVPANHSHAVVLWFAVIQVKGFYIGK